jgi:hypothetical protein
MQSVRRNVFAVVSMWYRPVKALYFRCCIWTSHDAGTARSDALDAAPPVTEGPIVAHAGIKAGSMSGGGGTTVRRRGGTAFVAAG